MATPQAIDEKLRFGPSIVYHNENLISPDFSEVDYNATMIIVTKPNDRNFEVEAGNLVDLILSGAEYLVMPGYVPRVSFEGQDTHEVKYLSSLNGAPIELTLRTSAYREDRGSVHYMMEFRALCGNQAAGDLSASIRANLSLLIDNYSAAPDKA